MKKKMAFLMAAMLTVGALTGCGSTAKQNNNTTNVGTSE